MAYTETQLALLKTDLGLMRLTDDQKTYMGKLLEMAASAIAREGITLEEGNVEDDMLIEMYAAWLYRKRQQTSEPGMPRMLRFQLNNKLASQKMKVTE